MTPSLHRDTAEREVTPRFKEPKEPKAKTLRRKGKTPLQEADRLFSLIVRARGECEVKQVSKCPSGPLQCAHIFSRRYRSIRFDEANALCACAGCHQWFTNRPLEWEDWLRARLGNDTYEWLRTRALTEPNPKLLAVIQRLRPRWEAIERRSA